MRPLIIALLAISFGSGTAVADVPDWYKKPPKVAVSTSGGVTTLKSNYISKHYIRFYISDGKNLYSPRRFPSGRWSFPKLNPTDAAYVRKHHGDFIFPSTQTRFNVEIHGKLYQLTFEDGEWVETPIESADEDTDSDGDGGTTVPVDTDEDDDSAGQDDDYDDDQQGSTPLCQITGTCGGGGSGSGSTSSSSSSGGGITPIDVGGITSGNPNLPNATKTTEASQCSALQAALNNAQQGEHIVADNTAYNCNVTMNKTGVVLRSKNLLGATFTGQITMEGSNNYLFGFKIHGNNTNVRLGGTNNKVLRNNFQGWPRFAITAVTGRGGEIGYNEFSRPCPWATCGGGDYPLRIAIRTAENSPSNFHFNAKVYRNYFHDFPTKPNPANYHSGQDDAMEVCQTLRPATAMLQTGWLIEYNLIANHLQGHGVMDFKCGGNIIRYNTMINSPAGRIDARNGHYNTVVGNWMEGTGGMTVLGRGHNYIGNRIVGGGSIMVMAADGEWNINQNGLKQRAYEVTLTGNNAPLTIGKTYGGETFPAFNTRVQGHHGNISYGMHTGTSVSASATGDVPQAVKLTPSQVGPSAN